LKQKCKNSIKQANKQTPHYTINSLAYNKLYKSEHSARDYHQLGYTFCQL